MPEPPDILQLTECPHCVYDLGGLPREHVCPECGFAYDGSMSMIPVWPVNDEPRAMGFLFPLFVLALFVSWSVGIVFGGRLTSILAMWPCAGTIAMLLLLVRRARQYAALHRGRSEKALVLSARGYAIRNSTGHSNLEPWATCRTDRLIRRLRRGRWRLRLGPGNMIGNRPAYVFRGDRRTAAALRRRIWQFVIAAQEEASDA